MLNSTDEAADVVQEVFIYLYQKTEKGLILEYPKSWLYRATLNKCIDVVRVKQKFLKIEDTAVKDKAEDENEENEKRELVRKALKNLKPKDRALAILYGEGLSYKEISEITGIRFTSVGKTLSRTLEKLGIQLKKFEHELH